MAAGAAAVRVAAGVLHGVREGAELVIVGEDGRSRGVAEVDRASFGSSRARWSPGNFDRSVPLYAKLLRPAETRRIRIRCEDRAVRERLSASGWADFVAPGSAAPYVLRTSEQGLVLRTDEGVRVSDPIPTDGGNVLSNFERECRFEARFRNLWSLGGPGRVERLDGVEAKFAAPTEMQLKVGDRVHQSAGITTAPARAGVPELALPTPPPGEDAESMGVLEITNHRDHSVHCYVLSLTETRKVCILHPYGNSWSVVQPGKSEVVRFVVSPPPPRLFPPSRPTTDRYLVLFSTGLCGSDHLQPTQTTLSRGQHRLASRETA